MTYSIFHSCLYLRNEYSKCGVSVMQKYETISRTTFRNTNYVPKQQNQQHIDLRNTSWCDAVGKLGMSPWGTITMTIILVVYISVNSPQLISRKGTRRLDSMTGSQDSSPSNGCRAICPVKPLLELTMTLLNMAIAGPQFATEREWHHMLMHRCNIAITIIILCNIQMDHI